jgi:hypothetical protein
MMAILPGGDDAPAVRVVPDCPQTAEALLSIAT